MRTLLLLSLLFLNSPLQAQRSLEDSLRAELDRAATDSARVMLHCALSRQYLLTNPVKAGTHAQSAEKLALAAGLKAASAEAFHLQGRAHLAMGAYDKALHCHLRALQTREQLKDTAGVTSSLLSLGNVYIRINDNARALRHYGRALELATKADDVLRLSKAYNNLGNVHEAQGEYRQALRYFQHAARLQEEIGDKKAWAISLHNIGNVHVYLGEPERGLPFLFKSVRLNEETGNEMIRMSSLVKIADIYQSLGALERARAYALQGLAVAERVGSSKKIAEAAQTLHAICAAMGDYSEAYRYLSLYTRHSEVLYAEGRQRVEAELTARYETEQRERENLSLKAEGELKESQIIRQRWALLLEGTLILLLLALLGVLCVNRRRLKATHADLQATYVQVQEQQAEISAQATALREKNEQLEQHSAFKNKVLSIVSHDLRSPFNTVKGVLGLAQQKNMSEGEVRHLFGLLGKAMEVATGMLDNVLVWAKSQLDVSGAEAQPVELCAVAEESLREVRAEAEAKGVRLINQVPVQLSALADRERLCFALRNLLTNAIKFSYPGGEVRLQAEEGSGKVMLAVLDEGRGMSPLHQERLFSESRFTTPGTANEKGTGLGLMLCKELVESFGGVIRVESEEGKGSTFFLLLPSADGEAAAVQPEEFLSSQGR